MIAKMRSSLGSAAVYVGGIAVLIFLFAAPLVVYAVFPGQIYRISEVAAAFALALSIIFSVLAIVRPIRPVSAAILVIASFVVAGFTWVWSVDIVGSTWGIGAIYVANLFFGVGTVFAAVVAALLGGHWGVVAQLLVISGFAVAMRFLGLAIAPSQD